MKSAGGTVLADVVQPLWRRVRCYEALSRTQVVHIQTSLVRSKDVKSVSVPVFLGENVLDDGYNTSSRVSEETMFVTILCNTTGDESWM